MEELYGDVLLGGMTDTPGLTAHICHITWATAPPVPSQLISHLTQTLVRPFMVHTDLVTAAITVLALVDICKTIHIANL